MKSDLSLLKSPISVRLDHGDGLFGELKMIQCAAVVERGGLRLMSPLNLADGTEVVATVEPVVETGAVGIAQAFAAIAAEPLECDDQGFSGQNHDQVLYGRGPRP